MNSAPALEIGGSHVTAALVDPVTGAVGRRVRRPLDGDAGASVLLSTIAAAANELAPGPGVAWGVAIPGPFDYATGIGRFHDVGKFAALNGFDVGTALRVALAASEIHFVNDAVAFVVGEWTWGAAQGHDRAIGITLGTGVGSSFLAAGQPVTTGSTVPPEGRADLLTIDGAPLEDVVSTRAIVAAYRASGGVCTNVADVVTRATEGDPDASRCIERAYGQLGLALAPWVRRFAATVVVLGGGITAAWELVSTPLREGLGTDLTLTRSADTEGAALRGATRSSTFEAPARPSSDP
ncbi:ROK family protein [Kribbella sp. NPDC055071]